MIKYIIQIHLISMNKSDFILILLLSTVIFIFYLFLNNQKPYAYVYYENNLIKKIDLKKDDIYKVNGYNGEVIIEVKDNKLRVKKENSSLHLCSKQGFVNNIPIVCLPNKIVIDFNNNEYDVVV